jgi:hypothetical protein
VLNRTGQQGNVYQAHQQGKWNPRSSAYGRFWIDALGGERRRKTVSLGLCATQWVARLRLREYIERAGVCSKRRFHQTPVPATTFRQQAEWWMESLSTRRRRPLKPATQFWSLWWQGPGCESPRPSQFALRILTWIARCCTYGEASGTGASKRRKLRTRFDSSISRRHWRKFYADTQKERMASSSRREPDGFLTSATHSKRCTEQGTAGDSTPFGAFALRYFAGQASRRT